MKRLLAALAAVALLAACGDETAVVGDSEVPTAEDITPIEKHFMGRTYVCFYIYVDGYQAGGPAMSCLPVSG